MKRTVLAFLTLATLTGCEPDAPREVARAATVWPPMAWDHRPEAANWTAAGLAAVRAQGAALTETLPNDIAAYCPGYAANGRDERAAFWVGLLSALARHESTWRPDAVGGGGQWFGLTQIAPATARGYGCAAGNGQALLAGRANIACAVRIAAHQVARDGYVVSDGRGWRGMARDWAPFRSETKRATMAAFTATQPYCS